MKRCMNILVLAIAGLLADTLIAQTGQKEQTIRGPYAESASVSAMLPLEARDALKEAFKDSIVNSHLMMPDEERVANFKVLIEETLGSRTVSSKLNQQWEQEGWECRSLVESNVIVIVERSDQRWGRGI